jgi:spoIIIJ-associated protein
MAELGIESVADANIEVIEAPTKGFLGLGGKEALVRVERKPKGKKRRRRRQRNGKGDQKAVKGDKDQRQPPRKPEKKPAPKPKPEKRKESAMTDNGEDSTATPEEQAEVVKDFLVGLVDSFGLEGEVSTTVEDDVIIANVGGQQTEALVGPKGSIMQSVNEIVRTVVQRKTHQRARLRLDIAGYVERRREALRIYAGRLAEQVLEEGGELMLEPMNPADRKVVHDAVVDIEGVRSFSEGEEPNRSVVIALAPGVSAGTASGDEDSEE